MSSCAGLGGGNKNTAAEEKEVLYCVCGVGHWPCYYSNFCVFQDLALIIVRYLLLMAVMEYGGIWCCEDIVEKG